MIDNKIINHYDYLMRLAEEKCNSQVEAEDLVGDTMLAAFAYIHKGGIITHPKTWLVNTLFHKFNDKLRKKYRAPVTVCLNEGINIAKDEIDDYFSSEECAKVRKELNHLSYITREVLIRFYYGNQSVKSIAKELKIAEGTVKSRLAAGRNQIKKGLETMELKENYIPGELFLSFGGSDGLNGEPMSLVEDDLIVQNLLILAYDKPLTISELSKAIGIPSAYIEPIVKRLVDGELMVKTNGGKVYSDFLITKPENLLKNFKAQLNFVDKHFDSIWNIIQKMSNEILMLPFVKSMGEKEKTKLERYAILKALQDFQNFGTGKTKMPNFPKRRDGGWWFAQAIAFDAGYNRDEYWKAAEYMIYGGHRTTEALSIGRTKRIRFYEFDTTLWDSPRRFGGVYELYFKHIIPLLWHIYDKIPLDNSNIPNELIAYIPTLETLGVLEQTSNNLNLQIPVLKNTEYDIISSVIKNATEEINLAIGNKFDSFIDDRKTKLPKHLTSVPELYRYYESTIYFVMGVVRKAYNKGLHLKDVNYCCPPVVLVYEE